LVVTAAAFVAMLGLAAAQRAEREVVIVSPTAESTVQGTVALAAEVRPPELAIDQIVFFVDGQRACAFSAPPYRCQWDAGAGLVPRVVRVIADLRGGGQLFNVVTTSESTMATYRGGVDLVSVSVHVRDKSGEPVRGLGVESFRAFEDGQAQTIVSLATEDAPADVILALDTSGSMGPAMPELKAAALGFLKALRPIDRPRLASFSTAFTILSGPSATPDERQAAVQLLTAGGGTALYDAIIEAADQLRTAQGRRAVVVFTDGDDVSSHGSLTSVRTALQTSDVVLYFIAQGKASADSHLRRELAALATETGGLSFFAPRMSSLNSHFSEILGDISTEYVLGYSPRVRIGDGGWRRIRVEVGGSDDRYKVRAREGYLAIARSGG
jgi:Ca-activated chloride channel family protein